MGSAIFNELINKIILKKKHKKILWVLSTSQLIPSDIVGCILPANFLKSQKIIISQDSDIINVFNMYEFDIIVFGKCFNSNVINLAKEASKRKIKTISCFNDWHFKPRNKKEEKQFYLNHLLARNSDYIVVKSVDAGSIIKKNTGFNYSVIEDCLRYKKINITNHKEKIINLLWFGTSSNHDTLYKGLREIELSRIKSNINVVTNFSHQLLQNLKLQKFKYLKIQLIPFSENNLINAAINSSIIIIPLLNDHIRFVKSSNRISDALNFGKFVIKSKTTYHLDLDKFCYVGNIGEGLNWFFKNRDDASKLVKSGQDYVQKNFSIKAISKKWTNLFDKL